MQQISKRFGATVALDQVDLNVERGEVHALVGENGSGKSTLMRVLSGAIRPDSGTIQFDGKFYAPKNPMEARHMGVAMIYQELAPIYHQQRMYCSGWSHTNLGSSIGTGAGSSR